ncbi:urease accessory protein UreF [Devosia submarina]|uniref:urease accessory protein UreF n=1 Tax=Devosia submarina TaxID=1173082 RepID=UPI000D3C8A2C|nr:urease accessory protein UreF [Devosia submarina]
MTVALQRLMAFLSPAFPVGGFAWSAGLETAIAEGSVSDGATTGQWLEGLLHHGSFKTDAILLCEAHRHNADPFYLGELSELCLALTVASERQAELLQMGDAFVKAAGVWPVPIELPSQAPYPIAVGAIAAAHGIGVAEAALAFLTAQVQAQISVAVRLVPIGQNAGLRALVALEPAIADLANFCSTATLKDLGTIGYAADIAQMRHDTLPTRIFRS